MVEYIKSIMIRITLLVLLGALPALAAEPLSVGFAEVDVTPELGRKPVFLAGFGDNRKATKIHDPIMARAVVLTDGRKKIALTSVDVVGLFLGSIERIRKEMPGFDYICVSATHNHEGPDTLGLWGPNPFESGLDEDYLKRLEKGVIQAINDATRNAKPASAEIGTARDEALLNDSREPFIKHDEIVVLRFRDASRKSLGILAQWNCHPEVLGSRNTEITADHVGFTVSALAKKHGCPVAYFTGTVGGLMSAPHLPFKDSDGRFLADGTFAKARKYGELIADLADKALGQSQSLTLTPFHIRTSTPLLPVVNPVYRIGWQLGKLRRPAFEWNGDPLEAKPRETKDASKPMAIRTEISLLTLGDLAVPVIPGEIYPELVLGKVQDPADRGADYPDAPVEPAIYPQVKSKHKMIIGLGNDELGYFIPKRQWDQVKPYCYGRTSSQYGEINSLGPDTAPLLCGAFERMLRKTP